MHAGKETKMLPGASVACVTPMIFGLAGMLLTYKAIKNGLSPEEFLSSTYHEVSPIAFSFLFGTPLAAWLACLQLRRIENFFLLIRWSSSFVAGFMAASIVQLVFSAIYMFGTLYLVEVGILTPIRGGPPHLEGTIIAFVFVNIISSLFITLPFSLLCATIFWSVTDFYAGEIPSLSAT